MREIPGTGFQKFPIGTLRHPSRRKSNSPPRYIFSRLCPCLMSRSVLSAKEAVLPPSMYRQQSGLRRLFLSRDVFWVVRTACTSSLSTMYLRALSAVL